MRIWLAIPVVVLIAGSNATAADEPKPVWSYEFKGGEKVPPLVSWVGFSPDGLHLAARSVPRGGRFSSELGSIRIWNLDTKKEVQSWRDPGRSLGLKATDSFVSRDVLLITSEPGAALRPIREKEPLTLWKARDQLVGAWVTRGGKELFTADGMFGELGEFGSAHFPGNLNWHSIPEKPREQSRTLRVQFKPHEAVASLVSFSVNPQGTLFAATSRVIGEPSFLTLDSIERTETALTLKRRTESPKAHLSRVDSVLFSPDGKLLATGSDDGAIHIWDTTNPPEKNWPAEHTLQVSRLSVCSPAFRPDAKYLAFGTTDRVPSVGVIDVKTGKQILTIPVSSNSIGLAFSPNGRLLATGSFQGSVQLWDVHRMITGGDN